MIANRIYMTIDRRELEIPSSSYPLFILIMLLGLH